MSSTSEPNAVPTLMTRSKLGNAETYMKPHNRALDIPEPPMQSISLPQIDRGHLCPPTTVIPLVIGLDKSSARICARLLGQSQCRSGSYSNQGRARNRGCFVGSPGVDGTRTSCVAIPASELTLTF